MKGTDNSAELGTKALSRNTWTLRKIGSKDSTSCQVWEFARPALCCRVAICVIMSDEDASIHTFWSKQRALRKKL